MVYTLPIWESGVRKTESGLNLATKLFGYGAVNHLLFCEEEIVNSLLNS